MSEAQVAERPVAQHVVTSENLAEFQLKRMGMADPLPAADPSPDSAPQAQEQSAPAENESADPDAAAQPEPEKKAPNPKLERRFSDLTRARKEAEARAEAERARREELEAKLAAMQGQAPQQPAQDALGQPAVAQADAEPQPHEFSDAFEYAKALAKWSSDQAVKRVKAEEVERKTAEERSRVISTWAERITTAKAELPDFDDMVASSEVQVTDAVRDAILESEVGPRILYHLAETPELGKKLAGMSISSQLREIGKLEARFEAKADAQPSPAATPAVNKPRAAPPITPLKAVAAGAAAEIGSDGEFRGSYQQWKQMRRAGKIK